MPGLSDTAQLPLTPPVDTENLASLQIAIVLYPGVTALDAIGPYEVLRWLPGAEIRFVWYETGPVITDSGVLALGVTHTLDETPTPDIVLVPGSSTALVRITADRRLQSWLRQVHETTTWTTSVCSGALVLASAGLLDGAPATTHWMAQTALGALGAKPQRDQRIVQDGKIVTAAGVSAGIDFALWLVGQIAGTEHAEMIQLSMEYDPAPPFDSGHPSKASSKVRRGARAVAVREGASLREAITVPKVLWEQMIRRIRTR